MSLINSVKNQDLNLKRPCYTQDKFWDIFCHTTSYERSYFKKVHGGWLLRHLFVKGRKFTRSSIIFFPDAHNVWHDLEFDVCWENVNTTSNPNYKLILQRLKVPEGWIVKEFLTTKPSYSTLEGGTGLDLTYIPDPSHEWEI